MEAFAAEAIDAGETTIFIRWGGAGPPVLLLHGFPESHLMWRDVAPVLARDATVVCADLRGYGRSGCPPSAPDHRPYAKRVMARDLVNVMDRLGFSRFAVAGHDRGGRVAYRMALDHPDRIVRLAVLDIIPTDLAWDLADARFALGYWPWSLLAQPEPLPEQVLAASAAAIVDHALTGWGSSFTDRSPDIRAAYVETLQDPRHAHAICEEYRAAATIDRDLDRADRAAGRRISCPVLAMWARSGPLDTWYVEDGGPLGLWQRWCDDVTGGPVDGGHFFPEVDPAPTAEALGRFFRST